MSSSFQSILSADLQFQNARILTHKCIFLSIEPKGKYTSKKDKDKQRDLWSQSECHLSAPLRPRQSALPVSVQSQTCQPFLIH